MTVAQVELTDAQMAALKELAAKQGVPIGDLIRRGVDAVLRSLPRQAEEAQWGRARAVAGAFRSGVADLSARHDDYLADAIDP